LKKLFFIGWKIFKIGVYLGNCGGDIEFLHGIKIEKLKYNNLLLESDGSKMRILLIHGFLQVNGQVIQLLYFEMINNISLEILWLCEEIYYFFGLVE